jgi:putative colanic acid biosysnthesis UDP-glucose lipid carrier transferase
VLGRPSNSNEYNESNVFIEERKCFLIGIIKVVDISIIIGLYILCMTLDNYIINKEEVIVLTFAIIVFEILTTTYNYYNALKSLNILFVIKCTFSFWLFVAILEITMIYFFPIIDNREKINLLYWFLLTPFVIIGWHFIIGIFLAFSKKKCGNVRRTVIVGATTLGLDLQKILSKQPWLGFSIVGFFDDRVENVNGRTLDIDLLGNYGALIQQARNNQIDVVFITLNMAAEKRIQFILDQLSDTSVVVYFLPNLFVFNLLNAKVENFNGLLAICVYDMPYNGIDGFSKKLFDMVFAFTILLLIFIPMIIISVGVKLSSPGPVLFIQRRYGFRGEEIHVWKFRTMEIGEDEDGAVVKQAIQNDPRTTKFGRFLRQTSMDEFPQFINVLQGKMSIVGPRPHAVAHNEIYRGQIKGYMLRHNVKPGITGLAQVRGFRGETDTLDKMEARVNSDLEYINTWSIWLDIKIIILTIFKGFMHENAY